MRKLSLAERIDEADGSEIPLVGVATGQEGSSSSGTAEGLIAMATPSAIVAFCVLAALYLGFVLHFSVNGLQQDDWGFVHLVHAAMHGNLTLGDLWTQHNENRMFVPNVIIVALAAVTHDNTRTVMVVSALLFIAAYVLFLLVLRVYLGTRLTALTVVSTGVLWFSLADWQNALWGFQFAWYLIILFLMTVLCLLLLCRSGQRRSLAFGGAILAAVFASFSSSQGLFLWPIGVVCLLWFAHSRPSTWPKRDRTELAVWVSAAIGTTGVYFLGYTSTGQADVWVTLQHPLAIVQSVLANIGEVIPTDGTDVPTHQLLGSLLLSAALFVMVQSFRHRAQAPRDPLPVALILFAFLFDPPIAAIRLSYFGMIPTLASRYTMANLLIPIAILVYVISEIGVVDAPGMNHRTISWRELEWTKRYIVGFVACFLALQLASATNIGLRRATALHDSIVLGSRVVVNRDHVPPNQRGCYAFRIEEQVGEVGDTKALVEAEQDHLSLYSPLQYRMYRAEGLPKECG